MTKILENIITEVLPFIKELQTEEELGDRSKYIGSSDVAGCPRKAVMQKLEPKPFGIDTLIRFERGHLTETMIKKVLDASGIKYHEQLEVTHPGADHYVSHIDFVLDLGDELQIKEIKSMNRLPGEPYESQTKQLQWQINQLALKYPEKKVTGNIFGIDLNSGKVREYDLMEPNTKMYANLVTKADHIWGALQGEHEPRCERDNLCAFCNYAEDCPAMQFNEKNCLELEEDEELYDKLNQLREIKEEIKSLDKMVKPLENDFKDLLANAKKEDGKGKIRTAETVGSFSEYETKRFDSKKFKEQEPALYEDFVNVTDTTRFTVDLSPEKKKELKEKKKKSAA